MHLDAKDCEHYYCQQVGGNYFQGQTAYQRGYGFFGDVRRFITPLAIRAGKYFGKQLMRTGSNVIKDIGAGESFKSAAKNRLRETSRQIKDDVLLRLQRAKGIKRKCTRKSAQIKKKRRKTTSKDIFS